MSYFIIGFLSLISFSALADKQAACLDTKYMLDRNKAELFWLDQENPKFDQRTKEQKEDWLENYIVTSHIVDMLTKSYSEDCLRG